MSAFHAAVVALLALIAFDATAACAVFVLAAHYDRHTPCCPHTEDDDPKEKPDVTDSPTTTEAEVQPPRVRPFADILREQAGGTSHDELSASFRDLLAAVQETGKAGTLTYTIKVERLDKAAGDVLKIGDAITLKAPKPARPSSVVYVDADGNATRRDPRQMEFESLRSVPAEDKSTAKVVNR